MWVFLTALLTPDLGLVFWTAIAFLLFLFLLSRYAWKPLLKGIRNREQVISDALKKAQCVEQKLQRTKEEYARLMKEAAEERRKMLAEAETLRLKIIDDARKEAQLMTEDMLQKARKDVNLQQERAFEKMKEDIAVMVVAVAEKVLMRELKDKKKETQYIAALLEEVVKS